MLARSLVRGGMFVGLFACTMVGAERLALANGFEVPENGTEVMGRAGAWTARADNPLAAGLNPAGLAGQPTAIILNANITYQSMCFQKAGAYPNPSANGGTKWEADTGGPLGYEGKAYPEVCKSNTLGDLNVVPQLGFNYAVNSKLGIAFLPLWTPSGTGKAKWPTEVDMPGGGSAPSPSRFLIVSKSASILTPTLAAGYEVAKGLRFGAGFQWVITLFKSTLMSQGTQTSVESITQGPKVNTSSDVKFNQWFTPAFVLGAMYSPVDDFDIGAMFRYSADIVYKGKPCDEKNKALDSKPNCDVVITAPYYGNGRSGAKPTYTGAQIKEFRLPQPLDLRLGFRFHPARKGVTLPSDGRRDFLKHEQFDIELDLTYSRGSAFDKITMLFDPGQNVYFSGGNGGFVPENASVTKNWKDTYGVRLGGEYAILPDLLSARAGGFFQTAGQDERYLNLDFHPGQMFGFYVGGTLRATPKLDVSIGYGHIFVKPFDNTSTGGQLRALVATPVDNPNGPNYYNLCDTPEAKAQGYSQPNEPFRSCAITNTGKLTSAYNMFSVGATYKF